MKPSIGRINIRHIGPFAAQWTVLVLAAAVFFPVAMSLIVSIHGSVERSSADQRAALLSAQIARDAAELRGGLADLEDSPGSSSEPSRREFLDAQRILLNAKGRADELHAAARSRESLVALGAIEHAELALIAFAESGAQSDRVRLERQLSALDELSGELAQTLGARSDDERAQFQSLLRISNFAILGMAAVGAVGIAATIWIIGRRTQANLIERKEELDRLAEATRNLEYRNSQFRALYRVANEVGETLSVKYVADTVLTQMAGTLIEADAAELRVLRGTSLEPAGSIATRAADSADGDSAQGAPAIGAVPLGEGLCGRVARRGRSLIVGEGAAASIAEGESVPGAESGIVVPLIVGARVVGTLAAWSAKPGKFGDGDLQILEMLAAQVATAAVAAETAEVSDTQAHTDPLTGLANRRGLARDAARAFGLDLLGGDPLALAMLDIDQFKRFNDEYGHHVGDIALQRVADLIKATLRDDDHAYRYGGEEFTIVLPRAGAAEALKVMERLRQAIEQAPLVGDDLAPARPVTVSIGVAVAPQHGNSPKELIEAADRALYESKEHGRNRVTLLTDDVDWDAVA